MTAEEVIALLGLAPLAGEGGHFRRTYESRTKMPDGYFAGTAIYYLVTPTSFSALHRLPQEELFHFYLGDPLDMVQITEAGEVSHLSIGSDLRAGQRPQVLAPGGVWQGTRLAPGGKWALIGATVTPGFEYRDFELGLRATLVARYPRLRDLIERFTYA